MLSLIRAQGQSEDFRHRADFEIDLIQTESDFRALQAEWTQLYEEAVPRNPFLSYEWTMACSMHPIRNSSPFILTARWKGRLAGVAPLRLERRILSRVLCFIGDERCDYLGFLQAPDHPRVTLALLDHLKELRAHWDVAILRNLSDTYTDLNANTIPGGLGSAEIEGSVSSHLSFYGNWEEMLTSGPSQLRHTRRWERKFELHGGTIERVVGHKVVDFAERISEIEALSWKSRLGATRFQSGHGRQLLRQVLGNFGQRGEIEI